jgi:predicted phage terminase large subunit-like protein
MATATATKQYSEVELFEIERSARLEIARQCAKEKDILGWGEALFPEKFPLAFCRPLHGYFVEIRHEPFTNTEAPRNNSKTTIKCELIPLFQALEEPETFDHYLNVQATATKAIEVNRSIRDDLESPMITALYGDQITDRWTDAQFITTKGVVFSAIGAGQSVRGIRVKSRRPDYVLVDDLYDEDDIYNAESTRKKNRWFWGSLYPALARSKRHAIHVQGTAINSDDILEELKKKPGVRSRSFKSIIDEKKGIVLWPELRTLAQLKVDRVLQGPIIFGREQQNERLDDTTTILKRSQWKVYKELPSGFDIIVTSWDMTFKETKSGSFVVGQIWGRRGADFYLFPTMVRDRMSFSDALIAVQNLDAQLRTVYHFTANGHLVEEKANGSAVMSMLGRKIPGLVAILPHGSKVARAAAITPSLSAGNVWIPDESIAPWQPEFVEECAKFRGIDGEVNDQVDATTQGVNYLLQTRYVDPDEEEEDDADFVDIESEEVGSFNG